VIVAVKGEKKERRGYVSPDLRLTRTGKKESIEQNWEKKKGKGEEADSVPMRPSERKGGKRRKKEKEKKTPLFKLIAQIGGGEKKGEKARALYYSYAFRVGAKEREGKDAEYSRV